MDRVGLGPDAVAISRPDSRQAARHLTRPASTFQDPVPHDDHDTIDGDIYVSPRHLARATAIGDPGLDPLRALGWDLHYDDLGIMWNQDCQGACR
ncbi:hypothetical protein [Streptomyces sp. NPDC003247]|uniref:hypothetical protein n=1 Tax=Streptomyces sp. NPDC003247 TaxID=3364677 RepID=UPI003683AA48